MKNQQGALQVKPAVGVLLKEAVASFKRNVAANKADDPELPNQLANVDLHAWRMELAAEVVGLWPRKDWRVYMGRRHVEEYAKEQRDREEQAAKHPNKPLPPQRDWKAFARFKVTKVCAWSPCFQFFIADHSIYLFSLPCLAQQPAFDV